MQQALRYEAEYFDEKKRVLRAIFNETLGQYAEAYQSKNISRDKIIEMDLKADDERYIRNMLENPISIVLMGNRPSVKARIVNYILGYELLPVFDLFDPDYNQSRRSVRIMYGTQRRHAFCIRHFELLECAPSHTERVVSFDDLRLDPVLSRLGVRSACSNNSIGTDAPSSVATTTTSGLESGGEQSNTPTTVSYNSSSSLHKSHPLTSNVTGGGCVSGNATSANTGKTASSSVFSSQCTGRQTNIDFVDEDYDDDEEDLGEVDFTNEMTTMEIILPHELLEKNLQIRVAPDVENFDIIYRTTFHRTNPIIIYCFERYNEKLTDVDVSHLEQLRQMMPSTPILFAHIIDFDPSYNTCRLAPNHVHLPAHVSNHYATSQSQATFSHHQPPPAAANNNIVNGSLSSLSTGSSITSTNNTNNQCIRQTSPVKGQESSMGTLLSHCNCNHSELTESEQQQCWTQHQYQNGDTANVDPPATKNSCTHVTSVLNDLNGICKGSAGGVPNGTFTNGTTVVNGSSTIKKTNGKLFSHVHHPNHHCYPIHEQSHYHCDDGVNFLFASESIWSQLKEMGFFQETPSTMALQGPLNRQQQRLSNGYYIISDRPFKCTKQNADYGLDVSSRFICHSYEFCYFVDFFRSILKSNLVVAATLLNEIHNQFIQYFIFSAFDMTWSLNYSIPKRLEYARNKEAELYMSLMGIANRKQEEIRQLIGETLEFMRDDILNQASNYTFTNPCLNKQTTISAAQVKDCIEEIQEFVFVMLNRAIAIKLISSVDVMRETFIGTLERCLKMLENTRPNTGKLRNEDKIDYALSRLLNLAYSIEINVNTCSSIVRIFWEKMKNFFLVFSFSWKQNCTVDKDWKRKVAADLIDNLSESKLAKCICTQFREKLKNSHETFVSSLANLESVLMNKLKETDQRRQKVRKNDAPLFARLALESTSFIDAILYGTPELGKEIGRGQYGVVFSAKKSWGHYSRIAIKSIMICDDNHWNDLSMEFYYARSLPENDRIVQIRGSIIEHNYNGTSSYVYLIMDRMTRDLYAGLKSGLSWLARLQISLDVVHGLRFLHNHGLIHRDIKLKNVLLDRQIRAKITDLGFCKSEVMISGSIVGTPIHMAPEVFTGKYDSMVDVYAFGILFWYICAGSVELPQIFEQCHNKDHLWIAVKKGLRPDKLPIFDDECFTLMERCWAGEPGKRPLLGEVEECLLSIKERYCSQLFASRTESTRVIS